MCLHWYIHMAYHFIISVAAQCSSLHLQRSCIRANYHKRVADVSSLSWRPSQNTLHLPITQAGFGLPPHFFSATLLSTMRSFEMTSQIHHDLSRLARHPLSSTALCMFASNQTRNVMIIVLRWTLRTQLPSMCIYEYIKTIDDDGICG